jgi:hypothetical protein
MTTQELYKAFKDNKVTEKQFLYEVRKDKYLSNFISPVNTADDVVKILKNRGVISEEEIAKELEDEKINRDYAKTFQDYVNRKKAGKLEEEEYISIGGQQNRNKYNKQTEYISSHPLTLPSGKTAKYISNGVKDSENKGEWFDVTFTDNDGVYRSDASAPYVHIMWNKDNLKTVEIHSFRESWQDDKEELIGWLLKAMTAFQLDDILKNKAITTLTKKMELGSDDEKIGLQEAKKQKLKGGKGDKLTPDRVNYYEFRKGWKHEMEHTDDIDKAKEIALDHLAEDPNYYTHLQAMETREKMRKDLPKEVKKAKNKKGKKNDNPMKDTDNGMKEVSKDKTVIKNKDLFINRIKEDVKAILKAILKETTKISLFEADDPDKKKDKYVKSTIAEPVPTTKVAPSRQSDLGYIDSEKGPEGTRKKISSLSLADLRNELYPTDKKGEKIKPTKDQIDRAVYAMRNNKVIIDALQNPALWDRLVTNSRTNKLNDTSKITKTFAEKERTDLQGLLKKYFPEGIKKDNGAFNQVKNYNRFDITPDNAKTLFKLVLTFAPSAESGERSGSGRISKQDVALKQASGPQSLVSKMSAVNINKTLMSMSKAAREKGLGKILAAKFQGGGDLQKYALKYNITADTLDKLQSDDPQTVLDILGKLKKDNVINFEGSKGENIKGSYIFITNALIDKGAKPKEDTPEEKKEREIYSDQYFKEKVLSGAKTTNIPKLTKRASAPVRPFKKSIPPGPSFNIAAEPTQLTLAKSEGEVIAELDKVIAIESRRTGYATIKTINPMIALDPAFVGSKSASEIENDVKSLVEKERNNELTDIKVKYQKTPKDVDVVTVSATLK